MVSLLPELKVVHNNTGNQHIEYHLLRRLYKHLGPKLNWTNSTRQEMRNMQCERPNNW